MVQANFKLIDFSFKLLLNTKTLSLSTLFSFNRCSKRIHSTGMVFPCVIELVFFLSNTSINLLSYLCQFKLGTENLILISQILVFPLDNIKLFNSFILGCLQAEQFRAIVPSFILRGTNLSRNI